MSETPHVDTFIKVARSLGLRTKTYKEGGNFSKIVKISHPDRKILWMLAPKETGFYPNTPRWFKSLSNSKPLAEQVLRDLGYHTVSSTYFNDPDATKAELTNRVRKLKSFPYLVKPEEGCKGRGIALANNTQELLKCIKDIHAQKQPFMVQPVLFGTEYRVLVINNKVRVAHTKEFPHVTGNGKDTISVLLESATTTVDNNFLKGFLEKHNLTKQSVPEKGYKVPIHITRKGSTEYYSERAGDIPPHIQKWGSRLAKDLSVPTVGIDVFIPADRSDIDNATIIEINANPGFKYIAKRYKDKQMVRQICTTILKDYFKLA